MAAKKAPAWTPPESVVEAVKRDLESLRERDEKLADSALAASAMALARELDAQNSATSKSMCAKALIETLDRLAELAPPAKEADRVDDLASRRAARRAAAS